jgi:hypothetical protein
VTSYIPLRRLVLLLVLFTGNQEQVVDIAIRQDSNSRDLSAIIDEKHVTYKELRTGRNQAIEVIAHPIAP